MLQMQPQWVQFQMDIRREVGLKKNKKTLNVNLASLG